MEGQVEVVVSEVERIGKRRRRYMATLGSGEQGGRLTYTVTCALWAEETRQQVVVGEGADWIKTQADLHFPQAVKILNWPHLWRIISEYGSRSLANEREEQLVKHTSAFAQAND